MPYVDERYLKEHGLRGFGQTSEAHAAVGKLREALRDYMVSTGNTDYHPGTPGEHYGINLHAAIIRVSRDLLNWTAGPGCQSLCNTLRSSAEELCATCIAEALPRLASWPIATGFTLDAAEVAAIVDAYREFLHAYIAEYGEGGELDPAQIAWREDVSLEEGERLAVARRDCAERGDTWDLGTNTCTEAVAAAAPAPDTGAKKAGFGWLWLLLFVGVAGGMIYASVYRGEKEEARALVPGTRRGPLKLPRGRKYAGEFGCGCGG